MNPTTFDPTARALIIEATTREAHAWTLALIAAALAVTFFVLWLGSLRHRAQAHAITTHVLEGAPPEASPKYLQRREAGRRRAA